MTEYPYSPRLADWLEACADHDDAQEVLETLSTDMTRSELEARFAETYVTEKARVYSDDAFGRALARLAETHKGVEAACERLVGLEFFLCDILTRKGEACVHEMRTVAASLRPPASPEKAPIHNPDDYLELG